MLQLLHRDFAVAGRAQVRVFLLLIETSGGYKKSGCRSECAKPPGSLAVAASDWILQHTLRKR